MPVSGLVYDELRYRLSDLWGFKAVVTTPHTVNRVLYWGGLAGGSIAAGAGKQALTLLPGNYT